MKIKNLIISPHIDDEVLSCYSFLNDESFICYLGAEDRPDVNRDIRVNELKKSAEIKKFAWELHEFNVNRYTEQELIPVIEDSVNRLKPETILIPHYSYNQDHRAVYNAAITATRPHDRNHFVPKVLIYEEIHTFIWSVKEFEPNYFMKIDINEKIDLYTGCYKSQVRGHRSPEAIKALALLRGLQSGSDFAEAFYCKRFIA